MIFPMNISTIIIAVEPKIPLKKSIPKRVKSKMYHREICKAEDQKLGMLLIKNPIFLQSEVMSFSILFLLYSLCIALEIFKHFSFTIIIKVFWV